jgi:hypothetical protein
MGHRRGYIPSESAFTDRALTPMTRPASSTCWRSRWAGRDHHLFRRPRAGRTIQGHGGRAADVACDYASVFESDVPIIMQYTRLDRQAVLALLSTLACSEG